MSRRKYIRTTVPLEEFVAIQQAADVDGLTIAEFARVALARLIYGSDAAQVMRASLATADTAAPDLWADVREILRIVRHLKAEAASDEEAAC